MLSCVLFVSTTGTLLYYKEFVDFPVSGRQLASLISAIFDNAIQRVGIALSYIEYTNCSISIASDIAAKVRCVLCQDSEDGEKFGALLSQQLLSAFVQEYNSKDFSLFSSEEFESFSVKIADVIKMSVRPVLDELQRNSDIISAMLISGDKIVHSTKFSDRVAVLANLQFLLGFSSDIMHFTSDTPQEITMVDGKQRLLALGLDQATLVIVTNIGVDTKELDTSIAESTDLIRRIVKLNNNLS